MRLETVKNYLDITWTDPQTDAKVTGEQARAESWLNDYAGEAIDFTDETTPEAQLLLDCCRYIHNKALEDFKVNFADELFTLRQERQASRYAASNAEKTDTDV